MAICAIGIIASVVIGFIYVFVLNRGNIIISIATMIIGSLVSWLSTVTLYGLGELIENTNRQTEILYQIYMQNEFIKRHFMESEEYEEDAEYDEDDE